MSAINVARVASECRHMNAENAWPILMNLWNRKGVLSTEWDAVIRSYVVADLVRIAKDVRGGLECLVKLADDLQNCVTGYKEDDDVFRDFIALCLELGQMERVTATI